MATAKLSGKRADIRCKPNTGFSKNPIFECGQTHPTITKVVGRFKVSMPHGRTRYGGEAGPIR